MDIELQNKLLTDNKVLFLNEEGFVVLSYVECGNGWFDIISTLLQTIRDYVEDNEIQIKPYFTDISEKNGVLRIYINNSDKTIDGMIVFAEAMSSKVCEITGEQGTTYLKHGILKTLSPLKARELDFIS